LSLPWKGKLVSPFYIQGCMKQRGMHHRCKFGAFRYCFYNSFSEWKGVQFSLAL
jgi:hypothetical protein